jgi:peptidoglycan/xylan/chitin deacetylase (PgdA/CDA1 family)
MALLRSLPGALGYWSGIAGRDQRRENAARILSFHGTPREQAREFERQLRYLQRRFELVSLQTLVDRIQKHGTSLAGMVAVTFDDGLHNNVSVAYPILQQLGIPATFFVCPELIEQRRWLWNHQARQRLEFASPGLRQDLGTQFGAPPEVEAFVAWMKTLGLAARRCVESALRDATPDFAPSAAERHEFDPAGWDELRSLDAGLVTIGSHGMTHAILTSLNARETQFEIEQSRCMIEAQLGRAVEFFAYPNSEPSALALDCVRRHYAAAVACAPGWVRPACDPHLLPRIAAPRGGLRLAAASFGRRRPLLAALLGADVRRARVSDRPGMRVSSPFSRPTAAHASRPAMMAFFIGPDTLYRLHRRRPRGTDRRFLVRLAASQGKAAARREAAYRCRRREVEIGK